MWSDRRDNATAENSDDTPSAGATRHPAGGVPRRRPETSALLRDLADELCTGDSERALLQLLLEHLVDGGIVVRHAGDYVLTWPDAGVSRRLDAGSWG